MAVHARRRQKVARDGMVTRLRPFPTIPERSLAPGAEVGWETVLGMYASRQRLRFVRVEVSGDKIAARVLVGVGQKVRRGEVLAYYSCLFGLGYTEYKAPCDGEVISICQMTGSIGIEEALAPLRANMPGRVETSDDALGVRLRSRGDSLRGEAGAGYGRSGVLEVKVSRLQDEARPQDIGLHDAGKILVVGKRVTQEILEACLKFRVAGVIAGSAQSRMFAWYKDLAEKLDCDELLVRHWGGELRASDSVTPPPTEIVPALVITEGFGDAPMSGEVFDLLTAHAGERAFIDGGGAFRSTAAERLPCVFIPAPGTGPAAGLTPVKGLEQVNPGDRVRVCGSFGPPGESSVLEISEEDVPFESGLAAPGVKVRTQSGDVLWVPVFNVEKAD